MRNLLTFLFLLICFSTMGQSYRNSSGVIVQDGNSLYDIPTVKLQPAGVSIHIQYEKDRWFRFSVSQKSSVLTEPIVKKILKEGESVEYGETYVAELPVKFTFTDNSVKNIDLSIECDRKSQKYNAPNILDFDKSCINFQLDFQYSGEKDCLKQMVNKNLKSITIAGQTISFVNFNSSDIIISMVKSQIK